MSLPLMTRERWERMSWYAQMQWQAARRREVREAALEHDVRYGPLGVTPPEHERGMTADERIAEIEWLTAGGTAPAEIVTRLGVSPHALERQMQRRGRRDLAALFSPLANAADRHPCPDCGAPTFRGSARCVACANRRKHNPAAPCARRKLVTVLHHAEAELRAVAHKAAWNRAAWGGTEAYLEAVDQAKRIVAAAKREIERHERGCDQCGQLADTRRIA